MSIMSGTDLNVKVDATTQGFEKAIDRATQATTRYDASLKKLESDMMKLQKQLDDDVAAALDRQHDAMDKTGRAAFVFGAAIGAALGMAANEAVKWESAWAGVTKTVDGSAAQMEVLESGLRNLATTLPATHDEIAAVAEAAGQLGIARDAVIPFTKTMIDLAETTNLTADEAATSMARFANIMQTPQDEIDRLGASLVALGNAGASTEADILNMGLRIAGAGAQLNLSEGDVMGLANALSSVGINAEAGGSAISQVMKEIDLAVLKGAGDGWARVAGMTEQAFAALWNADAAAGLEAFTSGLARIKAEGGSVIGVLDDMKINEIRQSDALLRLAGSGDLLAESLKLGNEAWAENAALLEEANKRYATTESRVRVAGNQLRDAAIDVGAVVLPAIGKAADVFADMGTAFDMLPGPVKTVGTALIIAAGAVAFFGGAAMIAVPKVAAFKRAVDGLEAGALKSAGTRLQTLGSLLMGPWGIALAAGTTALGVFAAKQGDAEQKIKALTQSLDQQSGAITDSTRQLVFDELFDNGTLDAAEKLGLSMSDVVDAALRMPDAMARVNAAHAEHRAALQASADGTGIFDDKLAQLGDEWHTVRGEIATGNEDIESARSRLQLMGEAGLVAADGTAAAGDAAAGAAAGFQDGAYQAEALGEEIKTLLDLFEALSDDFLTQREAERGVREGMRGLRKELAEYKKEHGGLAGAFKEGSKSADEFGSMLDGIAQSMQEQIGAVQQSTGSQRKTLEVYREQRARLIDVADQLGMTRKQAERYVKEVLGTPRDIRTFFNAETTQAEKDVRRFTSLLDGLNGKTVETFVKSTMNRNDIGEFGSPRSPGPKADGGIVQAFAGGGIVDRVPQMRSGSKGAVLWGEPETGWEAYISGKPGMQSRNRDVWLEAGRRLGMVGGSRGAAVASSGGGSAGIDYGKLAGALAQLRPLYGDVHMQPHNYSEFARQMTGDRLRAEADGIF